MKIEKKFELTPEEETQVAKDFELFEGIKGNHLEAETFAIVRGEGRDIVAIAQYVGNTLYAIQSRMSGAGRAIIEAIKKEVSWDGLTLDNAQPGAIQYWENLGFEKTRYRGNGWDMVWYPD